MGILRAGQGTWDKAGGSYKDEQESWACFKLQGVSFQGDENILEPDNGSAMKLRI